MTPDQFEMLLALESIQNPGPSGTIHDLVVDGEGGAAPTDHQNPDE